MRIAYGISWDDGKGRKLLAAFIVPLMLASLASVPTGQMAMAEATRDTGEMVSVIVRAMPGAGSTAERLVADIGGKIEMELDLIDGFAAEVPARSVSKLAASDSIRSVTPDQKIKLLSNELGFDVDKEAGSMYNVARSVRAPELWKKGATGQGIDVALIDSGVVPVAGLDGSDKVVNGTDISFEQGSDELRFLDTNGHGTHLAGIIAGRDAGVVPGAEDKKEYFTGIAPSARIVNVKVANSQGATDVSQVIAAIDWVIDNRNRDGMNIRVLNLAFGTDGVQDYRVDPLTFAAEQAWRHGIVVVVAGGNSGFGSNKLNNPAYDPFVIAVGADDTRGTYDTGDDVIPDWSATGDGTRNPDLVAPGKSLISLRSHNSHSDLTAPEGRVADRFFKGSGTSQAAAVVSGAAALVLSHRPSMTPDQVKALLTKTAQKLPSADPIAQGAGLIDLKKAEFQLDKLRIGKDELGVLNSAQSFTPSDGSGSLEAARGSVHVVDDEGNVLTGEIDIFGNDWSKVGWSKVGWSGVGWSKVGWSGVGWSGVGWSGKSWSGKSWSKVGWSGVGWSKVGWSGKSWSGVGWSGVGWSGVGWSGVGWSGVGWSRVGWS